MKNGFRQSMAWLHTWSGLSMGWILFAVFLTGTLSFFRQEITLWMQPELHGSIASQQAADLAVQHLQRVAPSAESWRIDLPNAREPVINVSWREPGQTQGRRGGPRHILDATTGEQLFARDTRGGDFLYRFHFELYALPRNLARAIVGVATMFMLVGLISGIVTHKKIFTDFFTFRPKKSQRSWLDAHAATAVLALPFHIMITFSGLLLVASTLLFWNYEPRGSRGAPEAGSRIIQQVARETVPVPTLAPLLAQAQASWNQPVGRVVIDKPLTSAMTIQVNSLLRQTLTLQSGGGPGGGTDVLRFDANGDMLKMREQRADGASNVQAVSNTFGTLHRGLFAGPLLRWLFFLSGILGCLMIATGLVLWCIKRARNQLGRVGFELVSALNIAAIAGLSCATAIYFWANRLIPAHLSQRADWEINSFFISWGLLALLAIWQRHKTGWIIQLSLAAVLFSTIPLLDLLNSEPGVWNRWVESNGIVPVFNGLCLLTGLAFAAAVQYLLRPQTKSVRARRSHVTLSMNSQPEVSP